MSSKSRPAGLLGCSTVGQSISPIALRDMFQSILYHLLIFTFVKESVC